MDLPRKAVNPTAQQYRATAAFHERAAVVFTLDGQRKLAIAARGLAFICRQRADRMQGA